MPEDNKTTTGTTSEAQDNTVEQKISNKEVKSTVEYHIYHNNDIKYKLIDTTGDDIEKTAQELKNARVKAKYIYHDSSNTEHDLGTYDLTVTKNTYSNYGDVLGGDQIYLVNINNINNYSNTDSTVQFNLSMNTTRPYANDVTTAALLGAMIKTGYTDFTFNGGSNAKGESPSPSESHKNGMNLDMRYIRTDKSGKRVHLNKNDETGDPCGWKGLDVDRQNKFLKELKDFGWSDTRGWEYWDSKSTTKNKDGKIVGDDTATEWATTYANVTDKPKLKNIKHLAGHNDHIHLQGFSKTLTEMPKDTK